MEVTAFDIIAIIIYFSFVAIFAYLTRRTKTFSEFSIAKHTIPATMIFASLSATYVGPGFSVGLTSKGYVSGYLFYFLAFTYIIQTILVGILIAPKLSKFRDCHTLGDVLEKFYGKFSHLLGGIISVGLCIGFSAIMAKIGGGLLQTATGLPLMLCIAIVTTVTALYTFSGGIRASIATDGLQFGLFSIIIPVMLLFAFFKSDIPASQIATKAIELTREGFGGMTAIQIVAILLSFLLGETLIPPYANRALAAKSSGASKFGFITAGCFGAIWLGIVFSLGVYGHQLVPDGTNPDDVFITMGIKLLPSGALGLLLAALIAIVMSSQDSVMNAGSVAIVRDILGIHKQLPDRKALLVGRIGTIVIAAVATIVARYSPSIIEGLLICYSIWAPSVLFALLVGLFCKKTVHAAGWLSILAGGLTSIIWQAILKEPAGVPAILVGLVAAAIAYFVGNLIGNKESVLSHEGESQ